MPTVPGGSAIGGGLGSPFVGFFNQLAAPELAQSERAADLVWNNPKAAKIEGASRLGSLLFPPLAIAGAEGLGLFGAGAIEDWLAGATSNDAASCPNPISDQCGAEPAPRFCQSDASEISCQSGQDGRPTTIDPSYAFDGTRYAIIDASPERPVTVRIPQMASSR
jgi:hypothetical protein